MTIDAAISTVEQASQRLEEESRRLWLFFVLFKYSIVELILIFLIFQIPSTPSTTATVNCRRVRIFRWRLTVPFKAAGLGTDAATIQRVFAEEREFQVRQCPGSRLDSTKIHFFSFSLRFFFKTTCEDPDNPIIQEEIVNDDEILPLFEGKVMGLVKPFE